MRLFTRSTCLVLTSALALVLGAPAFSAEAKKSGKKSGEPQDGGSEEGAKGTAKKKTAKKAKAKEQEKSSSADLVSVGTLGGPAKGDASFIEFNYTTVDEKKKAVKNKAWLKVDSGTTLLVDHVARVQDLKEGDTVKIFGKPMDLETGGRGGNVGGKDYNLNACRIILGGKDVTVNESFSDPKDKKFKWCEATIDKAGPKPSVSLGGTPYRMTMDKTCTVLVRSDADQKKDVKKSALVLVEASTSTEKPAGEKEDRPAFRATKIVVLEKSQQGLYLTAILDL